jgi:hypothetical protein
MVRGEGKGCSGVYRAGVVTLKWDS